MLQKNLDYTSAASNIYPNQPPAPSPRFLDPDFLPNLQSISTNIHSSLRKDLTFAAISEHPQLQSLPLFSNKSSISTLRTNFINHDHFLNALRVLSLYPELLERIFLKKNSDTNRLYSVMLCDTGEWRLFHLDEHIVIDKRLKRPAFILNGKKTITELWPFIIEKAFAKCLGAYELLSAGCYEHTMRDLTGACYSKLPDDVDPKDLLEFLLHAIAQRDILTCFQKEEYIKNGHQPIYLILSLEERITGGTTPRGKHTKIEHKQPLVRLRDLSKSSTNGEVVINLEELSGQYYEFCSIKYRSTYKYASVSVRHEETLQHTALNITVDKPMEVTISINQRDARCFAPNTSPYFNYYEEPSPTFRIETINDNRRSPNASVDISNLSQSPAKTKLEESINDSVYTYSPARLIVAQTGQNTGLKYINGTLSRARNTQLTLNLEPGTYIVFAEVHWVQQMCQDFTISFYSEEKLQIRGLKNFDADAYINAVIKDLADTSLNKSWGQEDGSDVINYSKAGCAEIYRTIGMASGLMWFYYRNESKSFALTESVDLFVKSLIISQTDGIKACDEVSAAVVESEGNNTIQVKVAPSSDRCILLKLTDLEYTCKYRCTSAVQSGLQTTPKGKPPLHSKGLFRISPAHNTQQREMFGNIEDIPVSDIYNDILQATKKEDAKDSGNDHKSLASNNTGSQVERTENTKHSYKARKNKLSIQGTDDSFISSSTFGRMELFDDEERLEAGIARMSPKFNLMNKIQDGFSGHNAKLMLGSLKQKLSSIQEGPNAIDRAHSEEDTWRNNSQRDYICPDKKTIYDKKIRRDIIEEHKNQHHKFSGSLSPRIREDYEVMLTSGRSRTNHNSRAGTPDKGVETSLRGKWLRARYLKPAKALVETMERVINRQHSKLMRISVFRLKMHMRQGRVVKLGLLRLHAFVTEHTTILQRSFLLRLLGDEEEVERVRSHTSYYALSVDEAVEILERDLTQEEYINNDEIRLYNKDIMQHAIKMSAGLERIGLTVTDAIDQSKKRAMCKLRIFEGHREGFQSYRTINSALNYSVRDESIIKSPFKSKVTVKESLARVFSMKGGKSFESSRFDTARKTDQDSARTLNISVELSPEKNLTLREENQVKELERLMERDGLGQRKLENYLRYESSMLQTSNVLNKLSRRLLKETFEAIHQGVATRTRIAHALRHCLLRSENRWRTCLSKAFYQWRKSRTIQRLEHLKIETLVKTLTHRRKMLLRRVFTMLYGNVCSKEREFSAYKESRFMKGLYILFTNLLRPTLGHKETFFDRLTYIHTAYNLKKTAYLYWAPTLSKVLLKAWFKKIRVYARAKDKVFRLMKILSTQKSRVLQQSFSDFKHALVQRDATISSQNFTLAIFTYRLMSIMNGSIQRQQAYTLGFLRAHVREHNYISAVSPLTYSTNASMSLPRLNMNSNVTSLVKERIKVGGGRAVLGLFKTLIEKKLQMSMVSSFNRMKEAAAQRSYTGSSYALLSCERIAAFLTSHQKVTLTKAFLQLKSIKLNALYEQDPYDSEQVKQVRTRSAESKLRNEYNNTEERHSGYSKDSEAQQHTIQSYSEARGRMEEPSAKSTNKNAYLQDMISFLGRDSTNTASNQQLNNQSREINDEISLINKCSPVKRIRQDGFGRVVEEDVYQNSRSSHRRSGSIRSQSGLTPSGRITEEKNEETTQKDSRTSISIREGSYDYGSVNRKDSLNSVDLRGRSSLNVSLGTKGEGDHQNNRRLETVQGGFEDNSDEDVSNSSASSYEQENLQLAHRETIKKPSLFRRNYHNMLPTHRQDSSNTAELNHNYASVPLGNLEPSRERSSSPEERQEDSELRVDELDEIGDMELTVETEEQSVTKENRRDQSSRYMPSDNGSKSNDYPIQIESAEDSDHRYIAGCNQASPKEEMISDTVSGVDTSIRVRSSHKNKSHMKDEYSRHSNAEDHDDYNDSEQVVDISQERRVLEALPAIHDSLDNILRLNDDFDVRQNLYERCFSHADEPETYPHEAETSQNKDSKTSKKRLDERSLKRSEESAQLIPQTRNNTAKPESLQAHTLDNLKNLKSNRFVASSYNNRQQRQNSGAYRQQRAPLGTVEEVSGHMSTSTDMYDDKKTATPISQLRLLTNKDYREERRLKKLTQSSREETAQTLKSINELSELVQMAPHEAANDFKDGSSNMETKKKTFRNSHLSLDPRDSVYDDSSTNYQSVPMNEVRHPYNDHRTSIRQPPSQLDHNSLLSNFSDPYTPSHRRVASLTTPRSQFQPYLQGPQSFRGNENRFYFPNVDQNHHKGRVNSPSNHIGLFDPSYRSVLRHSTASGLGHLSLNNSNQYHSASQYIQPVSYHEEDRSKSGSYHHGRPSQRNSAYDDYAAGHIDQSQRGSIQGVRAHQSGVPESPMSYWVGSPRDINSYIIPQYGQTPQQPYFLAPTAQQLQWQASNTYLPGLRGSIGGNNQNRNQSMRGSLHGSVMDPEVTEAYKLGTMMTLLDKFYSLEKLKLMNNVFQKLIVYNHKLELHNQRRMLKLEAVCKKRHIVYLSHAIAVWRNAVEMQKAEEIISKRLKDVRKSERSRILHEIKSSLNKEDLTRKKFAELLHRQSQLNTVKKDLSSHINSLSQTRPNNSIEAPRVADFTEKLANNTSKRDFDDTSAHHARRSSMGSYYTTLRDSAAVQAPTIQSEDSTGKIMDPLRERFKNRRQASFSQTGLNSPTKHREDVPNGMIASQPEENNSRNKGAKVTNLALGQALKDILKETTISVQLGPYSAKASLTSDKAFQFKPKESVAPHMHLQSYRDPQSENRPPLTIEQQQKREFLLAKFRSERRDKVRTAVDDELMEIKQRLKLIGATDAIESEDVTDTKLQKAHYRAPSYSHRERNLEIGLDTLQLDHKYGGRGLMDERMNPINTAPHSVSSKDGMRKILFDEGPRVEAVRGRNDRFSFY